MAVSLSSNEMVLDHSSTVALEGKIPSICVPGCTGTGT